MRAESRVKQSEVWFEGSETQYDSWLDVRKQSEVKLMQQLMVAADGRWRRLTLVGLWSNDIGTVFPPTPITDRESPEHHTPQCQSFNQLVASE